MVVNIPTKVTRSVGIGLRDGPVESVGGNMTFWAILTVGFLFLVVPFIIGLLFDHPDSPDDFYGRLQ